MPKEIVFARQPILDREENLVGYELLFRGKKVAKAKEQDVKATSSMLTGFLGGDYKSALQGKRGFINMDEVLIKSGAVELLPKENFVIEVLETVEILHVVERLERYKKEGYTIALDDFVANEDQFERYVEFFYLFDIIKFDIKEKSMDESSLSMIVESLKNFGIKLLAEKVETKEEYERYRDLGFDYFQGYYFMKPQIASQKMLMPGKREILELWTMGEEEFDKIIEKIKRDPELSINILKLLNSSYFNLQKQISSISQALAYLGIRNFKKWLLLMLYAHEERDAEKNPWLDIAKSRSNFMSETALQIELDREKAYLVGVLSVFGEVMGEDDEMLAQRLPILEEEIKKAIIFHTTPYGKLLAIVKKMERGDFESWSDDAKELHLDPERLATNYTDALRSRNFL